SHPQAEVGHGLRSLGRVAGEVAPSGIDRVVTALGADLLNGHAVGLEETGVGPAQVVRPQVRDAGLLAPLAHDVADALGAQAVPPQQDSLPLGEVSSMERVLCPGYDRVPEGHGAETLGVRGLPGLQGFD